MSDIEPGVQPESPLPPNTRPIRVPEQPLYRAFTFFTAPFDKDATSPYWKQIIEQGTYLIGTLLNDRTFRWSLDVPSHEILQEAPTSPGQKPASREDELARLQIRSSPLGDLPYDASIRGRDPAAVDNLVSYFGKNLGNLTDKMNLRVGELINGNPYMDRERFKGRFSDYLQTRKAR